MLTLEECIEYFETEAETSDSLMMPYEPRKKYSDDCKQMADWLRELRAYREVVDNKSFEIADPLDPHRHNVLVVKVTDLYNDFFDF